MGTIQVAGRRGSFASTERADQWWIGPAATAAGLVLFFGKAGIPAFSEAQRYSYGGDFLYPALDAADVVSVPVVMMAVCLFAAIGPAIMASRLRPADALRYV